MIKAFVILLFSSSSLFAADISLMPGQSIRVKSNVEATVICGIGSTDSADGKPCVVGLRSTAYGDRYYVNVGTLQLDLGDTLDDAISKAKDRVKAGYCTSVKIKTDD